MATPHVFAEAVRGKLGPVDISAVAAKIEALLDEKIEGVAITAPIIAVMTGKTRSASSCVQLSNCQSRTRNHLKLLSFVPVDL